MKDELAAVAEILAELPQSISSAMDDSAHAQGISQKLDVIIELLREQKIALEKYYDDFTYFHKVTIVPNCSEISFEQIAQYDSIYLLGYHRKDISQLFSTFAAKNNITVTDFSTKTIAKPGDIAAMLTNGNEGDYLLFSPRTIVWNDEILDLFVSAISKNELDCVVGRGAGSRSINFPIPKFKYIFFDATDLYMPNRVKEQFDCCFTNNETMAKD